MTGRDIDYILGFCSTSGTIIIGASTSYVLIIFSHYRKYLTQCEWGKQG